MFDETFAADSKVVPFPTPAPKCFALMSRRQLENEAASLLFALNAALDFVADGDLAIIGSKLDRFIETQKKA